MRCILLFLVALLKIGTLEAVDDNEQPDLEAQPSDSEDYETEDSEFPEEQFKSIDELDEEQSARLSDYLTELLQRPGTWEAPIIMVKDTPEDQPLPMENDGSHRIEKRTRFYRRSPIMKKFRWIKNKNTQHNHDCSLTKDDVIRLLQGVVDVQKGKKSVYVNICNRRTPASAVSTNIRFLGRKRK